MKDINLLTDPWAVKGTGDPEDMLHVLEIMTRRGAEDGWSMNQIDYYGCFLKGESIPKYSHNFWTNDVGDLSCRILRLSEFEQLYREQILNQGMVEGQEIEVTMGRNAAPWVKRLFLYRAKDGRYLCVSNGYEREYHDGKYYAAGIWNQGRAIQPEPEICINVTVNGEKKDIFNPVELANLRADVKKHLDSLPQSDHREC